MISDIVKASKANLKSFQPKFTVIQESEKLIIKAFSSENNMQYIGQIQPHPYIDFDDIKQLLQEQKVKILINTHEVLKIKIGMLPLELIPKSKSQIDLLKDSITKYLEKQEDMQSIINSQKNKIDQHDLLISDLKAEVAKFLSTPRISIKMMEELKSDFCGKFNELRQNLKSETLAIIITMNQQQKMVSIQQKMVQEFSSKLNGVQKEIQLLKTMQNQIKQLKLECKNLAIKQINDLKLLINKQSFVIDEKKTIPNKEISEDTAITKKLETKLMQYENPQEKIKFQQELGKLQSGLKQKNYKNELNEKTVRIIGSRSQKQLLKSCKWSQQLKSNAVTIKGKTVTLTKQSDQNEFCLLDVGFSKYLKDKQSWTIKIKKLTDWIYLGICSMNQIRKYKFNDKNIKWGENGHGFYMMGSGGSCFSNSQKEFNRADIGFEFVDNDVILVEYDPIEWRLRFSKNNKQSFEMPIIAPPYHDEYHPVVLLSELNESVELI